MIGRTGALSVKEQFALFWSSLHSFTGKTGQSVATAKNTVLLSCWRVEAPCLLEGCCELENTVCLAWLVLWHSLAQAVFSKNLVCFPRPLQVTWLVYSQLPILRWVRQEHGMFPVFKNCEASVGLESVGESRTGYHPMINRIKVSHLLQSYSLPYAVFSLNHTIHATSQSVAP